MPEAAIAPSRSIRLHRFDLDTDEPDPGCLSPDELQRAARFVFGRDRRRYVAGRTALRRLLAETLDRAPDGLRFAYNACGKPRLEEPGGLSFNLSHSGALCVVALSSGGELGIDVERVGPYEADVAAAAFSHAECRAIEALPEAERGGGFARCWTRKEAFIKALGLGFSYPSREVTVGVGREARILASRPEAGHAEDWRLLPFEPDSGFVGAVAAEGEAEVAWGAL